MKSRDGCVIKEFFNWSAVLSTSKKSTLTSRQASRHLGKASPGLVWVQEASLFWRLTFSMCTMHLFSISFRDRPRTHFLFFMWEDFVTFSQAFTPNVMFMFSYILSYRKSIYNNLLPPGRNLCCWIEHISFPSHWFCDLSQLQKSLCQVVGIDRELCLVGSSEIEQMLAI